MDKCVGKIVPFSQDMSLLVFVAVVAVVAKHFGVASIFHNTEKFSCVHGPWYSIYKRTQAI